MFGRYLTLWNLTPDGDALHTHSSDLLPVRTGARRAMLKIPRSQEERLGARLMVWWNGDGAARVYQHDEVTGTLLLERATGRRSLVNFVREGRDSEASLVLCEVAAILHASRPHPLSELVPLPVWFSALAPAASRWGGVLHDAAEAADALLASPQDVMALHGDLHHQNVLDGEERGWLAIDPKGLLGERGFDYANILNNPDLDVARHPGRLARQVQVVAQAADLDVARLLTWVLAYTGLSAAWWLEDGREAEASSVLEVARIAAGELCL